MSWEIRSTITRYGQGPSIFTPPICTNSAVTPGTPMALMRSTSAPGKTFSMPNRTPMVAIRGVLRGLSLSAAGNPANDDPGAIRTNATPG